MSSNDITAGIIVIGNEILSGQTADINLNFIAQKLQQKGIKVCQARLILDDRLDIIHAVNEFRQRYTYVLTTGGIGPTHDDITTDAIARASDVQLERHPQAVACLQAFCQNTALNSAQLKMADIPVGATLIPNSVTGAPGFILENVYVMAGVPKIMQAMLMAILPNLASGLPLHHRVIHAHLSESLLADGLTGIQNQFPDLEIGSYPQHQDEGRKLVRLSVKGHDLSDVDAAAQQITEMVQTLEKQKF